MMLDEDEYCRFVIPPKTSWLYELWQRGVAFKLYNNGVSWA